MATMEAPSVEEISDDFLQKQIRTKEDGTVTTEIDSVRVYPFDEGWFLRIESGEPFPDHFLRVPLGDTRAEAIEELLEFYPDPFENLEQMEFQTVEVDFDAPHRVSGPPEAMMELEVPVLINGYQGYLVTVPQIHEYHFDKRDDADEIQQKIEDEIIFYREIPRKMDSREDVPIKYIEPLEENLMFLHLGGFPDERTLPILIKLPSIDSVSDHPVSEFIQSVGSGKVENLEDEFVYICEKDASDEVVGLDSRFERYGIAPTPPEQHESSGGFLSRFF